MKAQTMKWLMAWAACAAALAMSNDFSGVAWAAEHGTARGGAADLIQLKPIRTPADVAVLAPGDRIVMSCPKCKTISVTYAKVPVKRGEPTSAVGESHLCPGCSSSMAMKGHGKSKSAVFVHRCVKCGSKDLMCCVMKGGGATPGMEPK